MHIPADQRRVDVAERGAPPAEQRRQLPRQVLGVPNAACARSVCWLGTWLTCDKTGLGVIIMLATCTALNAHASRHGVTAVAKNVKTTQHQP